MNQIRPRCLPATLVLLVLVVAPLTAAERQAVPISESTFVTPKLRVDAETLRVKASAAAEDPRLSRPVQRYFSALAVASQAIASSESASIVNRGAWAIHLLNEGLIAGMTLVATAQEEEEDDDDGGGEVDITDRMRCLGDCLSQYNECMEGVRDNEEDDDDGETQIVLGSDDDGGEGEEPQLPGGSTELTCKVEHSACVLACEPIS